MREPGGSLSASELRRVDETCDRFEAALRAGERPAVDAFLGSVAEPARAMLARELRALERAYGRPGPRPAGGETRAHPDPPGAGVPHTLVGSAMSTGREGPSLVVDLPRRPPASPEPRRFGDYELLDKLGQGGMGEVFRARQVSANRLVVLKIIRRDRLEDLPADKRAQWVERFRIEAHTAAQMEHPNIVPVYQVGEIDGQHYYSMRFIPGRNLGELAENHPLPPRRAAAYLEVVARAVHHAHGRGILHRDLKPRNIIIDADDRPYVTDFGLAKWLLGGPSELTAMGTLVGSPPYIAPEQVIDASAVTVAADVYGLGATLYHLLTGRPPFHAGSVHETLRQVQHDEPVPPAQLVPGLDRDLETICLKCLEKDPRRRYGSAQELADDLRRYLDHQPVRARRTSAWERGLRHLKRHRAVAALGVLLVAVLALGLGREWRAGPPEERPAQMPAPAPAPPPAEPGRSNAEPVTPAADVAPPRKAPPPLSLAGPIDHESFGHLPDPQEIAELEKVVRDAEDSPAGHREAAWASRKAGRKLEQLGALARAEEAYGHAVAFLESLGVEPTLADQWALAAAWHELGVVRFRLGKGELAKVALLKARDLKPAQADGSRTTRTDLARTYFALGRLYATLPGGTVQAANALAAARKLQQKLDDDSPDAPKVRAELALTCDAQGMLHATLGRLDRAGPDFGEAARFLGQVARAEDTEPAYQLEFARVEVHRASLLGHQKQLEGAGAILSRTIQKLKSLHKQYLDHAPTTLELAAAHATLGVLLWRGVEALDASDRERPTLTADAAKHLHEARACLGRYKGDGTEDVLQRRRACEVRSLLGGGFVEIHDWPAAESLLRAAIAGQEELLRLQPPSPDDANALALSLRRLARLRVTREQSAEFLAVDWMLIVPTRDPWLITGTAWRHLAALRAARDEAARAAELHRTLRQEAPAAGVYRQREREDHAVFAEACLLLRDHANTVRAAEAMAELLKGTPQAADEYVDAAKLISLCVRLVRDDTSLSEGTQLKLERAYGDRAIALLQAARDSGLNRGEVAYYAAFGALRQRQDFRALFPGAKW